MWSLAELNVRDRTLLVQKILDLGCLMGVIGVLDAGGGNLEKPLQNTVLAAEFPKICIDEQFEE